MDINTLREYLKIHLISLEQDLEALEWDKSTLYITGKIDTVLHILGVMDER